MDSSPENLGKEVESALAHFRKWFEGLSPEEMDVIRQRQFQEEQERIRKRWGGDLLVPLDALKPEERR